MNLAEHVFGLFCLKEVGTADPGTSLGGIMDCIYLAELAGRDIYGFRPV